MRVRFNLGVPGAVLVTCGLAGCNSAVAPQDVPIDVPPVFGFGNGAPSGAHYNLNIIGVPREKTADMTGDAGHRIFVMLGRDGEPSHTRIYLCEAGVGNECSDYDSYFVIDANGTDGEASAALPDPDPDGNGESVYAVYVRPLGAPGGYATNQTCGEVEELDEEGNPTGELITICSMVQLYLDRTKGKQSFIDATACLLYIYADATDDGVDNVERLSAFDDQLVGSWWDYTNTGLKLAQFRFYPVTSDTPTPDAVEDCTAKGKGNGNN